MSNKNFFGKIVLAVVAIVAIIGVIGFIQGPIESPDVVVEDKLGTLNVDKDDNPEGAYFGTRRQLEITRNGAMISSGTFTVGSGGTALTKVIAPANCTVIANANTIAATTSKDVDCAVTGAVFGDTVVAVATTSMSTAHLGVKILSATASSTSGFVTLKLINETGATFTWTGTASTSLKVLLFR